MLKEEGSNFTVKPHDTRVLYSLPAIVKFCSLCTMSNQRPRISFNSEGVCSACSFSATKNQIDYEKREVELVALLDRHRKSGGDFDVVVPCSGGKDGSFVAHQLKHRYGMNVLAVTWAPLKYTDIGRKNLDAFISTGFDHVLGTPSPEVTRRLTAASLREIGDPFQPFIYGQTNFPVSVAAQYGVGLVMYGENGEVEYGGDSSGAASSAKKVDMADKHYFSGRSLATWLEKGFTASELRLFREHPSAPEVEQHFFGHFKRWDPQENFYYAEENLGFSPADERSEGTYSRYASLDDLFDGFHYFLSYIKFGIGRATSDTAHEIRDGKISRSEGVELVKKFDGEFPNRHFLDFLDYLAMSEEEFWNIINSWRSPHIWKKPSTGDWELRTKIWEM